MGGGGIPLAGDSIKNYHLIKKLKAFIPDIKLIDTQNWKRNPIIFFNLLYTFFRNPNAKYFLSLSNRSAYEIIKILKFISKENRIFYFVIGGVLNKLLIEGKKNPKHYKKLEKIFVESKIMKRDLLKYGLNNVSVLPNFKIIPNIPITNNSNKKFKFVFLSRITPTKGCDLILECVDKINKDFGPESYTIDFYGEIENDYKEEFISKINSLSNVEYKGFLDLRNIDNYNILKEYSAMLFPTYWPSEGCPGIVIDAYIAGLPILASDWNYNREYIKHKITGLIFEAKSELSLRNAIIDIIKEKISLNELKNNVLKERDKYDIHKVLSKEFLINNGLVEG